MAKKIVTGEQGQEIEIFDELLNFENMYVFAKSIEDIDAVVEKYITKLDQIVSEKFGKETDYIEFNVIGVHERNNYMIQSLEFAFNEKEPNLITGKELISIFREATKKKYENAVSTKRFKTKQEATPDNLQKATAIQVSAEEKKAIEAGVKFYTKEKGITEDEARNAILVKYFESENKEGFIKKLKAIIENKGN